MGDLHPRSHAIGLASIGLLKLHKLLTADLQWFGLDTLEGTFGNPQPPAAHRDDRVRYTFLYPTPETGRGNSNGLERVGIDGIETALRRSRDLNFRSRVSDRGRIEYGTRPPLSPQTTYRYGRPSRSPAGREYPYFAARFSL
ncbi:hypothetical protein [Baaleninema simplex]|uniref:hypothetical protein n=1 Tax=Baaleninema simplex TaxID=2862350 RepID=UPI001181BA1B|nr:hypothetical protein [Baaleninema simplex]